VNFRAVGSEIFDIKIEAAGFVKLFLHRLRLFLVAIIR
jgi:hypothetical protein